MRFAASLTSICWFAIAKRNRPPNGVRWTSSTTTLCGPEASSSVACSFGLSRVIAGLLFGVKPWDPEAFLLAPLILSAVALFAVWLPAKRASELDPIQALRME